MKTYRQMREQALFLARYFTSDPQRAVESLTIKERIMPQYVKHMSGTGSVMEVTGERNSRWHTYNNLGEQLVLPKSDYRLCTEEGAWIPEWKDITSECQIEESSSDGLYRFVHRWTGTFTGVAINPQRDPRYRVSVAPDGRAIVERRA